MIKRWFNRFFKRHQDIKELGDKIRDKAKDLGAEASVKVLFDIINEQNSKTLTLAIDIAKVVSVGTFVVLIVQCFLSWRYLCAIGEQNKLLKQQRTEYIILPKIQIVRDTVFHGK